MRAIDFDLEPLIKNEPGTAWHVFDRTATDLTIADLRWLNGEVQQGGVHGPFESEQAAKAWCFDYLTELEMAAANQPRLKD